MFIGRRIYYDKITYEILTITSERSGETVATTIEQDFIIYNSLSERNIEAVGIIELEYGQYSQDFLECNDVKLNPQTLQLEFSYPDLTNPETPQPFQKPLTQQIEELKQSQADLWELILYGGSTNV